MNLPLGMVYDSAGGQAFMSVGNVFSLFDSANSQFASFSLGANVYLFREKSRRVKYNNREFVFFNKKKKISKNNQGLVIK